MQIKLNVKKKVWSIMIVLFFVFSSVALAGTIVGSPHDFRGYLWNQSGEICKPCHAPHHTQPLPAPLWNHELSSETYTMYNKTFSPTLKAEVSSQPDGLSKICLSCHDGTVALENYGHMTNGTNWVIQLVMPIYYLVSIGKENSQGG